MKVKNINQVDLYIFIFFFVLTSFPTIFRVFFNSSQLLHFIKDSLGNLGGVIVGSFLFFYLAKEASLRKRQIIILSVGLGFSIYEVLQILIPWQTFDINDIIGTFAGIILASGTNLIIVLWFKYKGHFVNQN
jgi:glycopeptide antibiotics resistance protein